METAFRVHPELRDYIRREAEDENRELERRLLEEGCRDPLVVWKEENVLVDGHHRFEICERHGIPYTVKYQSFADVKAAKMWMRKNQLARRNLTKEERDQWIREMRAEGMTQKEVAEVVGLERSAVAKIENVKNSHSGQCPPSLNQDELLALKIRSEEAEAQVKRLKNEIDAKARDFARTKKALDELAFDRNNAQERARALAKELEDLKAAAREPKAVPVPDAQATEARMAEIEAERDRLSEKYAQRHKELEEAYRESQCKGRGGVAKAGSSGGALRAATHCKGMV